MNPMIEYEFKSRQDKTVTVKSRLGESAARAVAMQHFYGLPDSIVPSRNGTGLLLLRFAEIAA